MQHRIRAIAFYWVVLTTGCLNAVIFQIEIWADKDRQHYRYFLKDVHLDYKGAQNTIQQQHDIIWALQQNKDTFLLVEDFASRFRQFVLECQLSDNEKSNVVVPNSLQEELANIDWDKNKVQETEDKELQLYEISPLRFLDYSCENAQIYACNVECGIPINIYRGLTYDNTQEHQEAQQGLYDALFVHASYLKSDVSLSSYCDLLDQKLEHLHSMIGKSDQNTFENIAWDLRSILLEASMLRELKEFKNIRHGYVITGALHIEYIKHNLPALGYIHIKTIGTSLFVDENEDVYTPFSELVKKSLDLRQAFIQVFSEQKLTAK